MDKIFTTQKREITSNSPVYIIAEIGMNHNGNVGLGKKMIKAAAASGADAVKFQTFKTELLINKNSADFLTRKKYELSEDDHMEYMKCAQENCVDFFSTPFDLISVDLLDAIGVDIIKISSADLTNFPLLKKIGKTKIPVIISTGYSEISDIFHAKEVLMQHGTEQMAVMHCVASYPTADEDVNIQNISMLSNMFKNNIIGFSDHSPDYTIIPSIAVSLGARIIEKHFTIDHNLSGYDHKMSLIPSQFTEMVKNIRRTEKILGVSRMESGVVKSELARKTNAYRSLYWAQPVYKGEEVNSTNLVCKRPSGGLGVEFYEAILGMKVLNNVSEDELVKLEDVG
jgi:N,N'-diacetyllegionaminate synthase